MYAAWFWRWMRRTNSITACGSSGRRGRTAVRRRRACETVSTVFFETQAQPDEGMMRHHGERLVMMPATPRPGLVMIHAELVFAFLEGALDRPPHPAHPGECARRRRRRGVAEVVFHLRRLGQRPAQDQPTQRPWHLLPHRMDAQERERGAEHPLGTILNDILPPRRSRETPAQLIDLLWPEPPRRHAGMQTRPAPLAAAVGRQVDRGR